MTDSLSAYCLSLAHSIPSRNYPSLKPFHWLRSSSHLSSCGAFLFSSRRLASPRRRSFLALPRARTDDGFFVDGKFLDANAHIGESRNESLGRSGGTENFIDDFDENFHDANSNTPGHSTHFGNSRNAVRARPQTARKYEYERFKEMFVEKNLEMIEESANAVGIPSLDAARSRMALLSESQPSRLHNRFVVFEQATESKMVRPSSRRGNAFSREDDPAVSATVPRTLPRQKPSYNGQGKSSAKNLGRFSSNAVREDIRYVTPKSTSSNFSSKLQIILDNFNRRDDSPATEPPDNATVSLGLQVGKNSVTESMDAQRQVGKNSISESLDAQREDIWYRSVETTRDTRKESHASKEKHSTFLESSTEKASDLPVTSAQTDCDAGTSSSFNLFSNAPPVPSETSRFSSGSKFPSPIGKRSMGASSQHAHVPPRRLSRSIGSRSSPSRSSIPGKFSKYSKRLDSNDKREGDPYSSTGRGAYTSTAETRPSSREEKPQFFFKSKEGLKSHASREVEEDTRNHPGRFDSFTGTSLSSSSSVDSFRESSTQVPSQSQTDICSNICSDSEFEISAQGGISAPPVVDKANHVSPLSEMSFSPEQVVWLSEERKPSTVLSDPNLDADERSLRDDKGSGLNTSRSVTKQSAMPSLPLLSAQSNPSSSTTPNLDVDIEHAQMSSFFSDSAAPQISAKNHPFSDLPFEFQYSYTETPNAPILRYREPQHSPFGPVTMKRPWTGRPPPKPSKKKPRIFDSFKPPPQGKKGIKYVQDPGPFAEGQSPKSVKTREEILGEPLTKEEVTQLLERCKNEKRQVNLGRDGLTHNMLDLVHSQWKRRRVCKIKCKGVPTVDMDNVYFHVEDKTGGKIIYRNGGVMFVFRGRNYNYKDRPKIPLMLWKPAAPVYPKLIQQAPGGLTKEQTRKLRLIGRKTSSICKLNKNGVYLNLVKDVKNAFKVDDLVRIDCRGLNPSDYKKIGAKLRDLVPCVLISFDQEHILLWKGGGCDPDSVDINSKDVDISSMDNLELEVANQSNSSEIGPTDSSISDIEKKVLHGEPFMSSHAADKSVLSCSANQEISPPSCLDNTQFAPGSSSFAAANKTPLVTPLVNVNDPKSPSQVKGGSSGNSQEEDKVFPEQDISSQMNYLEKKSLNQVDIPSKEVVLSEYSCWPREDSREFDAELTVDKVPHGNSFISVEAKEECSQITALWEQALESGMASEINEADLDTDSVLHKADELAKTAPPGPTYTQSLLKKLRLHDVKRVSDGESSIDIGRVRTRHRQKKKEIKQVAGFPLLEVPPMGGLPVDELARLLAPK